MKRSVLLTLALAACGPDAPPPADARAGVSGSSAVAPGGTPSVYVDTPVRVPAPASERPADTPRPRGIVPGCDPNYEPCVPVASDVDCAEGRGNGPAYVGGPVRVTGRDVYGLDRDGDGTGCDG